MPPLHTDDYLNIALGKPTEVGWILAVEEYQISCPPTEPNLANRSKNRVKKRYKNRESFSHLNHPPYFKDR